MQWNESRRSKRGERLVRFTEQRSDAASYHLRPIPCCILAGETDGGGDVMLMPVEGLTIGMARMRVAAGWCNLRLFKLFDVGFWNPVCA
jgi:hypothetical protein